VDGVSLCAAASACGTDGLGRRDTSKASRLDFSLNYAVPDHVSIDDLARWS
jgi:hypothetical protein